MANLNNRETIRVQSFNAGQFSSGEPTVVPEGAASELQNVIIKNLGQAQQRKGLERKGDNPNSLVSHWTFDASSSADDKGSNDGTDTTITYTDGKFGKAAQFDGAASLITVSADTSIDVNTIGSMSLSAWVNVTSDGENDVGRIFDKTDDRASPTLGYVFNVQNESASTVKLRFFVKYDGGTDAEVITSTTMSIGALHRVEAILNADDSADIYIDGSLASYGTDTTGVGSPVDDSSQDLIIGNTSDASATFYGIIDDARLYNVPLTAAESDLSKIYGLTRFRVPGTIDRVFRIRSGTLERLDDDFKDYTIIDSGFTTGKETNFVLAKVSDGTFRLFILNGTDNVHSMTTGEAITDEANTNADPPRSSQGEFHDNRLFLIDSNGNINFSDILDAQTFDRTTNIIRPRRIAKALKSFKEKELIIYEDRGIEVLNTSGASPLTTWTKNLFNENIEFASPRTVVNAGDDQMFLARDGVRVLSRTQFDKIETGIISQPIQDIMDNINQDAIEVACAWFVDSKYFLAIPTGTNTENDTVVIWDALAAKLAGNIARGWTVIPSGTWATSVFSEMAFNDNELGLIMGDNRSISLVYKALSNDHDNGTAIASRVTSIDHTVDRISDAIWDPVHVVAQSGINTSITIEGEVNRTGFDTISTLSLIGGAPILPIALPFVLGGTARARGLFRSKPIGRGRTFRLRMSHSTYNKRPTYVEYSIFVRKLNPRFT